MKIRKRTITVALMTFLMIVATFGLGSVYAAQENAAFDQSKSAGDVTVTVTADPGVLPDGAQLKVKPLSAKQEAAANKAIDKIAGDAEVAAQYNLDIDIIDEEGNEIQPDTSQGKVNVYFESEEIADENLQTEVFHIDGNKAEELDVATKGDEAVVEADGFSPYVVRFTVGNGTPEKAFELLVGHSVNANTIAEKVGLSGHGNVTRAISNTNHVTVTHDSGVYYVEAVNGWSGASTFSLELDFIDGYHENVVIHSHAHDWNLQLNEAKDTATLKCVTGDSDSCYYKGEYTETIAASDATYNGQPHGASLSGNISAGQQDMRVGTIHYASGHDTTTGGSTTAPTSAGKYTAYAVITADQVGGNKTATIYKNYTIAKANINLTEATPKNLTYNGQDQELYDAANAKSATTDQTFTVYYRYSDSESWDYNILKGRNAGKYTITYKAFGDDNHNNSEEKTLEVTIAQRAVKVKEVNANDKVYDGTTAATFDCSDAKFDNAVPGADLTVTAEGEFESRNAGDNKTVNITKYTLGGANASNYVVSDESTFTAKADITPKTIKVHWEHPAELQYTGEEQAPKASFDFAEEITSDDGKAFLRDEVAPDVSGKEKNVGDGYRAVVARLTGDDAGNYELDHGTFPVDLEYSIIPKILTVDWQETEKVYAAEALEPDWKLTGFVAEEEPTKTLTIEPLPPTELVDGEAINAGVYSAEVSLSGDAAGNYKITNPIMPFTITKAPLKVYAKGWICYGEKVTQNSDIHDLQYDKDKITGFKGEDGVEVLEGDHVVFNTNYNFLDDATGVNGAKYYLTPQFEKAENYEVTNAEGELTVYPKPVTLKWTHTHAGESDDVSGEQAFIYDGKLHTYKAEVTEDSYVKVDGKPYGDEITVELSGDIQRDAHVKNHREKYTAYAESLSNPNYALVEVKNFSPEVKADIETRAVDFTIAQRPIELGWEPERFTYNGDKQVPEVTIENLQFDDEGRQDEPFEVIVDFKQNSDPLEEARKDKSIEAGDYTVTATELADKNYTLFRESNEAESEPEPVDTIDFEYTIDPLAIQLEWDPNKTELTYNGKKQTQSMKVTNFAENTDAEEIRADSEMVDIVTDGDWEATDAGDYTATLSALGQTGRAGNYEFRGLERKWKINKLPVKIKWNPTATQYTYDGKDHKYTAEITNVQSNEEGTKDDVSLKETGTWTAKMPGSFKATISGLDGAKAGNYSLTGAKTSHSWKINKRKATVGKPTLTNVSAKSAAKTNTGYWRTVSGATSYDFAWRERGGKWSVANAGKTYYKEVKNHKSKGLYEYKVRARKAETATDLAAVGSYSNVLYRYYFTLQHIQILNEKGGFTVKWAKDSNATGYQVLYSTNKDGSNPKVITLGSNSITSRTVKGLKAGKVYYVQIRPIKKVGGTNYIGNISVIKPVKAL